MRYYAVHTSYATYSVSSMEMSRIMDRIMDRIGHQSSFLVCSTRVMVGPVGALTTLGGNTRQAIRFIDWMLFARYIAARDNSDDAFDAAPDAVAERSMLAVSLLPRATPALKKFCFW